MGRFEDVFKHFTGWGPPPELPALKGWEGSTGLHLSWSLGLKPRHGIVSISHSFKFKQYEFTQEKVIEDLPCLVHPLGLVSLQPSLSRVICKRTNLFQGVRRKHMRVTKHVVQGVVLGGWCLVFTGEGKRSMGRSWGCHESR